MKWGALIQSAEGLKSLRSFLHTLQRGKTLASTLQPPFLPEFSACQPTLNIPNSEPHNHMSRYPRIFLPCLSFLYICMYIHTYLWPWSWGCTVFLPADPTRSTSPSWASSPPAFALEPQSLALLSLQPADCSSWALSAHRMYTKCAHTAPYWFWFSGEAWYIMQTSSKLGMGEPGSLIDPEVKFFHSCEPAWGVCVWGGGWV